MNAGGRGAGKRWFLLALCLACLCLFTALGVWQVERRAWKLALIAAVDARVHAAPVAVPPPERWAAITREGDEYRRVFAEGRLLHERETLVRALTEAGQGYWVMTPLRRADGTVMLVNRGFVPDEAKDPGQRRSGQIEGPVRITGLLRISEPGGRFLRANRPEEDRWYARDVAAIARARGIEGRVAPFFIDADSTPNPGGWPRGGMTVIAFPNTHLIYALTWFGLALLSLYGLAMIWRARG